MRRIVGSFGLVLAMVVGLAPAVHAQGGPDVTGDGPIGPADVLAIYAQGETRASAVDIALRLSRGTFGPSEASGVVIARDDDSADAVAAGVLLRDAPLLLVPSAGPVPPTVLEEIRRAIGCPGG